MEKIYNFQNWFESNQNLFAKFFKQKSEKKRGKKKKKRGRWQHFGLGPEMAMAHFPLLPETLPPSLSLGH
jgi:hypothetical protein